MNENELWQEKKRRLAVFHLLSGGVICIAMLILLIWPGIIANFLLETFMLEMPKDFSVEWVFNGMLNILIFVALAPVFMFAPVVGVLLFLLVGLPSIIGAIRLLKNTGGQSWLRFASVFYIFIIPVGTVFAIFTLIRLRKLQTFEEKLKASVPYQAVKEATP